MKISHVLSCLITLSITVPLAANELIDGDFDSLSVGTAPDDDTPAGAWHFPPSYLSPADDYFFYFGEGGRCGGDQDCERSIVSIVPTDSFDPGADGNSLRVNFAATEGNLHLPNLLETPLTDEFVLEFETYVPSGGGSGAVYLSGNIGNGTGFPGVGVDDRGPQVGFFDGNITVGESGNLMHPVGSYSANEWIRLELRGSLADQAFDISAGPRDGELALLATDLRFRSSETVDLIDRVSFAYFSQIGPTDQYFDNVSLGSVEQFYLPGDANRDSMVNAADLNAVALNWQTLGGATWEQGDFTDDGNVDAADLNTLALNWQTGVAAPVAVPEPSGLTMLLFGLCALARRVVRASVS